MFFSAWKIPWFSCYIYCFYYLSISFNVVCFLLQQDFFYYKRFHYTTCIASFNSWEYYFCCFGPCHIMRVVSMKILSIVLILSMVLTFVFSNNASIFDKSFINFFLLLSLKISSSKSSCTDSARSFKNVKRAVCCVAKIVFYS